MALNKTLSFDLELKPGGIPPIIHASQGDIGRMFKANIYWDGAAATSYVSGATVNLRGKKPDKTVFDYTATLAGSMVTFETTEQMTIISGPVECELVFSNDGDIIASANFVLIVEESPYNPDALSESDVDTLGELVSDQIPPAVGEWLDDNIGTNAALSQEIADAVNDYADTEGLNLTRGTNGVVRLGSTAANGTAGIITGFSVYDESESENGVSKIGIAAFDESTGLVAESTEPVTLSVQTNGRYDTSGNFVSDTGRRYAIINPVSVGDTYYLTTHIGSSLIPAILYYNGDAFLSYELLGTGTQQDITNYEFTIPANCNKLIIQDTNTTSVFALSKSTTERNVYTKAETDAKVTGQKYGVKWEIADPDDLGARCFSAEGLTATIGTGTTNGASDFDNIYPWSEIKRCNIKQNANGAEIVTFEGETGFALDGSNGDVFVYIPKFYYERYQTGGYEYRVISATGTNPHPAFVEDGKELDALYIGAFEGYSDGSKLHSVGGVLPTSNITAAQFLALAKANGGNYSLYDNRCVDAIYNLMAVEYGCRNSNRILGYGYADFEQPATYLERDKIVLAATNTNTVRTIKWGASDKNYMPVGSNITVCGNNNQRTILTQAKITACVDSGDYTDWTFDGDPIDVDTTCFIGSAACNTNFCETVPSGALNWHTGRADWQTGSYATRRNPVRYRWIENIFGNLWHFLPDVTFYNLQMYVCNNMKDYEFGKHADEYKPENAIYTEQSSNGRKDDPTGYNYWVTDMDNGQFTKGIDFGRTFSQNLTSAKAFGAYYYLYATSNAPIVINNGGGFDHLWRCNILTQRAWEGIGVIWYLYGARLMYKHIS